jgi:hypothetical protein
MRGLIHRIFAGQASSPAPRMMTPGEALDAAIAQRREARRAKPLVTEAKRFAHARPKVEQMRHELAMQRVIF